MKNDKDMKAKKSLAAKFVCAVALVLAMASCGSKVPPAEDVANRINTGENITEADCTSMIEYCGAYAKEAQRYFDIVNAQPNDSTEAAVKATGDLAGLYARYRFLNLFRNALAQAEMSQLGPANEAKVNEYAQYQAFPLPRGADVDLRDPNVVGAIEQMPSDSSAVIATGVGAAVE